MPQPSLKQVLALDAACCAAFFAGGVGAGAPIAALLGLPQVVVAAAGWICLPAAILLAFAALRPSRALVGAVALMNAGWVLASLGVWLGEFGSLTPIGHAVVLGQALAVEVFILLEWRGMKALGHQPSPA